MPKEFKLPDIGEGVHEGEITKWLVREGDPIKEEQLFVEVMTDKVTVQLPSPYTGTVLKILAKEGEVVRVGSTIIVVGEAGEVAPTAAAPPPPPEEIAPPTPSTTGTLAAPEPSAPGEILATPAVRRLARELGVDLAAVHGTGPRGRMTEEDVRLAVSKPASAKPTPVEAIPAAPPPTGRPGRKSCRPDSPEPLRSPLRFAPKSTEPDSRAAGSPQRDPPQPPAPSDRFC